MIASTATLCQKLGYTFENQSFLEEALSHRSYHSKNNERLEFLGDTVLNLVITEVLYQRNPLAKEGELSRLRASLVCESTLASLAQSFQLGHYIRLGVGEVKSGGLYRISILADALEAIIGAIYLDSDIYQCRERILAWYGGRLDSPLEQSQLKDPKTLLQEYVQARKLPLPVYTVSSVIGAAHQQIFHVDCKIPGLPYHASGEGTNRKRAEQEAAKLTLQAIDFKESHHD